MSDMMKRLISEQRKRVVGGILYHAEESSWWAKLTPVEQKTFRDKVLSSVGAFYDIVLDVIKVNDGEIVNEHALALIEQIHDSQRRLERKFNA